MRYGGSHPPLCTISFEVVSGERSGFKPGRQRKDVDRAVRVWVVGDSGLADDGARQVSVADLDTVRFFCLPRHTRTAAFAVGLLGKKDFRRFVLKVSQQA